MSGYSFGDGHGVPRTLAHSIAEPIHSAVGKAKKQVQQHQRDELFHTRTREIANEQHERTQHFVKGQQAHELATRAADQQHEANMLKLSHTLQRGTMTHERKLGVTRADTTFSTPTVQANGGNRVYSKPKKPKVESPSVGAPSSSYESEPLSTAPAAKKPRKAAAPKPVPGVSFSNA